MDVVSICPLRASSYFWRWSRGAGMLTVIVRATFHLSPGESPLAAEQEAPNEDDVTEEGELRAPTDRVPFKARADVLLAGHAYPPARHLRSAVARIAIGPVQKSVEVFQDRLFRVIGFGPVAASWPARAEKVQHLGDRFSPLDYRNRPLPEEVDPAFFNAAPRDQQVESIADNQLIVLENLHPEHPRLSTSLPGVRPRVFVAGADGPPTDLPMRCDTLWIDTDRSIATLTFRAHLPVSGPQQPGEIVVALEEPGQRLSWADVELRRRAAEEITQPLIQPSRGPGDAGSVGWGPVMPFTPVPGAASAPLPPSAPVGPAPFSAQATPIVYNLAPISVTPSVIEPARPREPLSAPAKPGPEPAPAKAPDPAKSEPREAVQLVWFESRVLPRARKKAAWRGLLDALEEKPLDPDMDDPAFASERAEAEERREIFEILTSGEATCVRGVSQVLLEAVRDDGRFVPLLTLVAGELTFPFDEVQVLRALLTTAAPLAGGDEALKGALEAGRELLRMPDLMSSPAVADALSARVREAFEKTKRMVPAGYLDSQSERALLERRHYQRRDVFGGTHLRALIHPQPGPPPVPAPIPTYLPESIARRLPMFQRMKVRMIAEVQLRADQYEAHPAALRAFALARVEPVPSLAAPAGTAPRKP